MAFRTLLLAPLLGLATPGSLPAVPPVSAPCPTDPRLALLIAQSDLVVIGRIDLTEPRLREAAQKDPPDYLEIPVRVDAMVKGGPTESVMLRYYPKDTPHGPSTQSVLDLAGAPAILFLTHGDGSAEGLYFAGYSPDALRPATAETMRAVRADAERQVRLLQTWHADPGLPHFFAARALIARLGRVEGDAQQGVFDQLEALGVEAVPAIVAQMDDRRPLRTREIALRNLSPDAFESTRHYGPELVVDGLDAVLNQITGFPGSIVSGGSDRQRDAAVAGWRVYATDLACPKPR